KRWFDYLDREGKGWIGEKEAAHAPSLAQFQNQLFQQPLGFVDPRGRPRFQELDANGDGKVTRDEVIAYYRGKGIGALQLANGNQFNGGIEQAGEIIFRALDADNDGKLSKAELSRAWEVLRQFDLNDDEVITLQEIVGNAGAVRQPVQQFFQPQPGLTAT